MPANLTPQYSKAEEEYRRAQSVQEEIECLEKMLVLIPKHKGTEKLQADLKTRLKETREELVAEKKSAKKAKSYRVPRQGAGQIIVLGGPNGGKSRLIAELTNATPEVAPYPFTTREPFPAMMPWEDTTVQLVDTPPVSASHCEPYLFGMVRSADAVLLCFDGSSDDAPEETLEVINQFEQRKTLLASETGFDEENMSIVKVRTLLVVTRSRDPGCETRLEFLRELGGPVLSQILVDFDDPATIEPLRNAIFQQLGVYRVYTKIPGKPAEMKDPFTLKTGATVEDLAERVHQDLAAKLKFAKVWGTSAQMGQSVGREHVLLDQDVVELHA